MVDFLNRVIKVKCFWMNEEHGLIRMMLTTKIHLALFEDMLKFSLWTFDDKLLV